MVLSCWAGVLGLTTDLALSSKDLILSLSWLTRDLRYSSSSEGAIVEGLVGVKRGLRWR